MYNLLKSRSTIYFTCKKNLFWYEVMALENIIIPIEAPIKPLIRIMKTKHLLLYQASNFFAGHQNNLKKHS